MPFEPRRVSEESQEAGLGSLRGCLVEGDAEQRNRERRVHRRALVISVLVQSAVLVMLVLAQLFGKTERIVAKDFVPIPPYGHPTSHPRGDHRSTNSHPTNTDSRFTFHSPTNRASTQAPQDEASGDPGFGPIGNQPTGGEDCSWCVPIGDKDAGPRPPQPNVETPPRQRVVQMTHLDPAMLIRRVEPRYPTLAIQTHREGRVELRARIGTDGTIQSLEIVGGDPMFYLSAREAVSQWHYKPLILNGQPVEIDTHITVIYTMQH
jgi:periplasmic protein TonB